MDVLSMMFLKSGNKSIWYTKYQKATPGNKVSVYYTRKLKKNGKLYDFNIANKTFRFHLKVGEVTSEWNVGIRGMLTRGKED